MLDLAHNPRADHVTSEDFTKCLLFCKILMNLGMLMESAIDLDCDKWE